MSEEDRLSDSDVVRVDPDDAVVLSLVEVAELLLDGVLRIPLIHRTSSRSTWRDGHAHRCIESDEQSDEGEDLPSETERRSLQMHQIMKKTWNETDIITAEIAKKKN